MNKKAWKKGKISSAQNTGLVEEKAKYSEKDHVNKVYQHSLYQGVVAKFPEIMKKDEFEIEGTKYKWWTIEEMEADENIMKKNGDVVSFVKEKIK